MIRKTDRIKADIVLILVAAVWAGDLLLREPALSMLVFSYLGQPDIFSALW